MNPDREKLAREMHGAMLSPGMEMAEYFCADIAIAYADRRVAEAVAPLQKHLDEVDRASTLYWDAEDPENCILEPEEHVKEAGCGTILELQRGGVFETRWWFEHYDEEEDEYKVLSFASEEEAKAALGALSPAREGGE